MVESAGRRKPGRVQLVEVLIGAVCAGGPRLARARSDFERMDPSDGVQRLFRSAVDPELLAAVVGPRLEPVWVRPLREQYALVKQKYRADWVDVEKVWREQRPRWRRAAGSAGAGAASAAAATGAQAQSRGYPQRDPGPVRAGRRATPATSPRLGPKRSPVHRPVPAGVAAVADPEVETVAAPPDAVVSGQLADEVAAEVSRQEREADPASRTARAGQSAPAADAAPSAGVAARGAVNGLPAVPPSPPSAVRSGGAAPVRPAAAPSDDARIVLSGGAGALVERLLRAMADSRAQVDAVRRVWIEADGLVGGWDLWALDPAVADRVFRLQRRRER